jgi:hypothetical protein
MTVAIAGKLRTKCQALLKIVKRIEEIDEKIASEDVAWDSAFESLKSLKAKKAKRLEKGSGTVKDLAEIEEWIVGCDQLRSIAQYEHGKNCSNRRAAIAAAWSLQQEIGKIGRNDSDWYGDVKSHCK